MVSPSNALDRLIEGNRRFASGKLSLVGRAYEKRRRELLTGQSPFATVVGCSDSRAPVEIVFDQALGDLFVVRVAGNVIGPSQTGSVEYAAAHLGTPLVVVLGHSKCGAIQATIDVVEKQAEAGSPNLDSIVASIRPAVEALIESRTGQSRDELVEHAVRANVLTSIDHLRRESEILRQLIQTEKLLIVGAEYSLETGVVDFFAGAPEES